MEVIGNFYDGIGADMNLAQAWLEAWREKAEEMGFDLWQGTGASQSGRAGAVTTVTQEAFSRVEGLVTSIQIHAANIDYASEEEIVPALGQALDELHHINLNTGALPLILSLLTEIKRDGLKVN